MSARWTHSAVRLTLSLVTLLVAATAPAAAGWEPLFRAAEYYGEGQWLDGDPERDGSPADLASADFNGDGLADLVLCNLATGSGAVGNTVSVLWHTNRPDHQALYTGWSNHTVGSRPNSVATADFNLDGKPDIATCNLGVNGLGRGISILRGTGSGFGPARSYPLPYETLYIKTGDVNADGLPDVVLSSRDGFDAKVGVMLGVNGDSLAPPVFYPTGGINLEPIVLTDVTGDGILDILVGYQIM